jgi:hypothetical protein
MATLFGMFPFLKTLFADNGYQGPKFAKALAKVLPHLDVEIVKRSDQVSGFVVLPKRWVVAQSLPKARQGLGESQPKGARLLAPRIHPPHAQKTMQSGLKSPDGLSGICYRMVASPLGLSFAQSTCDSNWPSLCPLLHLSSISVGGTGSIGEDRGAQVIRSYLFERKRRTAHQKVTAADTARAVLMTQALAEKKRGTLSKATSSRHSKV